ncbi:MAG: cupin domain-containing protein, partial [Anaerolineales bacterium]
TFFHRFERLSLYLHKTYASKLVTAQLSLDGGVQKIAYTYFLNTSRTHRLSGFEIFLISLGEEVDMKNTASPGIRLRNLRTERKISQRKLAQMAGVSPNSISLIEREEISPSVATLQSLASALNIRMSYFFEDDTEQKVLHVKAKDRPSINSQGVYIESTGGRIPDQEMEPFLIHLAPDTSSGERQVIHTGHEVVYCLNGRFEYFIDGDSYFIEKGDFLLFEANLPHLWRNPFNETAEFILILQTPDAALDPVKRHFVDYPSVPHIG